MSVYFLRHVKSRGNIKGIISGQTEFDILPEQRVSRMEQCFDKVYCSSSCRCKDTLKLLYSENIQSVIYTDSLLERSLGILEGMKKQDAIVKFPQYFVEKRVGVNATIPNGETIEMVKQRLVPVFEEIMKDLPRQNILICSHNQTLKVLYAMIKEIEITDDYWQNIDFVNGEIKLVHTM